MFHPVAIIQWPTHTTYDGSYVFHGRLYVDHHQALARFRLQTGVLGGLRDAGKLRFLKVVGIKNRGQRRWAYLNCEEDLAAAAAVYHRSQSERYKQAERQQAPNGEWYLSPRAFQRFVGIGFTTLATWRKPGIGIPILGGEALDTLDFPDGNGERAPFYSERQAKRIVEARAAGNDSLTLASKAAKICRVDNRHVRKLALDGSIDAELRPSRIGSRTFKAWWVSVPDLRRELQRRGQASRTPKAITDPISAEKAAQLIGRHPATIGKLVRRGKIKGEYLRGGRRLVVSRDSVLAYQASLDRTLSLGGQEEWLRKRQFEALYPEVNWDRLRPYLYEKRIVPPLERQALVQVVERPPGLKSRHKKVRRFWAEDVRVLVEWLKAPKAPAGPSPSVQRALDFLKTYLADGRFHPRQEIVTAAAKEGIEEQSLNAAKPHLKDLVVENDSTRGEGRFTKWKLEKAVVMPGACSTNGRRGRHATDEDLSLREKVDPGCKWWEKLEGMHNDIRGARSDVRAVHDAVQETPQQTAELVQLQIGEVVAAKEDPTDSRGRWMFEKRKQRTPWKNIISELKDLAPQRGWEALESEPAASTALLRWCKDNEEEYPR